MNYFYKTLKILTVVGGLVIIGLIANLILKKGVYGHDTDFKSTNNFFIFKDSIKSDIDSLRFSYYTKNDVLSYYHYTRISLDKEIDFVVSIWEFKNLNKIKLENCEIGQANLDNVFFEEVQVLSLDSGNEKNVKYDFSFQNGFNIFIDKNDSIFKHYFDKRYKGYFGKFNKIGLKNKNGFQIIIDNSSVNNLTSFIIFKKKSSIYLVLINSEEEFNSDIINILDLKNL